MCHRPIEISAQPIAEEPTRARSLLWNTSIAKNTIVQEVATVYVDVGNLGTESDNKAVRKPLTPVLVVLERIVTRPKNVSACAYCRKPTNKFAMPVLSGLEPS